MSTKTPGAPNAYPARGGVVPTAPKHRVTHQKGYKLRPVDDLIPLATFEASMSKDVRWIKSGCVRDRDWSGSGVGCYHGTDNYGRSIVCEGKTCKRAPKVIANKAATATKRAAVKSQAEQLIRAAGYEGVITKMMLRAASDVLAANEQKMEYLVA